MRKRTEIAAQLSKYAQTTYRDWCGEPAYVNAVRGGYELQEPSPNASPIVYPTAHQCRAAIREIAAGKEE